MAIVDVPGLLPSQHLLALIWTTFSVAFLFVVGRTAIRFRLTRCLASEDYWIFLAISTLLTNAILQTFQMPSLYYLSALLAGEIPPVGNLVQQGDDYARFEFAIIGLFWTVLWCVKASFLAVYFKLFQDLPIYRGLWYVLVVFAFLAYVGCWISSFMTCHPISNYFVFGECMKPEDKLASRIGIYYSTVVDVVTDLCIMAMPINLILNVQISRKQKAGLVCVFGLCAVMIIVAIIRAKQILVEADFPNIIMLEIWSTIESSISVIVGCLPAFKSLISSRSASNRGYSPSGSKSKTKRTGTSSESTPRNSNLPLHSLSYPANVTNSRRVHTCDSQEEIVPPEPNSIVVKNDVTISYLDNKFSSAANTTHMLSEYDGLFRFPSQSAISSQHQKRPSQSGKDFG